MEYILLEMVPIIKTVTMYEVHREENIWIAIGLDKWHSLVDTMVIVTVIVSS